MTTMTEIQLVELVRESLLAGGAAVLPAVAAGFVVALVAGLVQGATGVHEPIIGFVPRLAVMGLVMVWTLPWMVERLAELFRIAAAGP
ncbi:MAG: Bacterial export protein family 3 [Planctomycetota bacterium]|jgi:flagellar biosynthesis protein FliQ